MCKLDSSGAKVSSAVLPLVPMDFNLVWVTGKWAPRLVVHAFRLS